MKSAFRKSFARDLKKIKDPIVLKRIRLAIEEVESASDLHEIRDLKKIVTTGRYYRIRVGEIRLGVALEGDVVEFIRCLPRRELYRYFP